MKKNFDGFIFLCCIGVFAWGITSFLRGIGGFISPVQMAMRQSFWELKLVLGLITGSIAGVLLGYLYNIKLHKYVFFGILGVMIVITFISKEGYQQIWGWEFAREMLPFSTSWLWAYFAGALLVHLLFKRVKKASQ